LVFESLAQKLQDTFKSLTGKGKLTEKDVKDAMREVKLALLEADVNFKIVKDFINTVTDRAIGLDVMQSLTPAQAVIKIVNEELTTLMGGTSSKITFSSNPPTVIMLVGLQGAGKTTTAAKLANNLKKKGKNPILVAADIYRPAAIKQLQVVGESVGVNVFTIDGSSDAVDIAKKSIDNAKYYFNDVVIIDTAGRLHIDENLMDELSNIKKAVKPHEILLVVDSMTGQDAVNVAQSFNEKLGIDGVIMTKLDGDTRGGAALSVKAVTQKPIKFACIGEKMDAIEEFHPDRMASRILGMGDVLSLIEKASMNIDESKARELEKKIKKNDLDLNDYLDQLGQIKKMGSIGDILKMIPGMNNKALKDAKIDDKELVRVEAIIKSMTMKERQNPDVLNASRRRRIATGSGTNVSDVNKLIKQFEETKKMMKQFSKMSKNGRMGNMKLPF
jgi:signal recognition particle subunit SRP54